MSNDWHLRHAVQVLERGGIVAHATEAVFGLACDPQNPHSLSRLLSLKSRSPGKGLILIGASRDHVLKYAAPLAQEKLDMMMATWPGPVTWVVPASPGLDFRLTGGRLSIALRVTAHPQAARLCKEFGSAIISTSANLSGHRPATTQLTVRRAFKHDIVYILPGRVGRAGRPSEIRDVVTDQVLRGS
jgi:L-threonylcarbamoyladenylate synthase